jgi:hypothetical protein
MSIVKLPPLDDAQEVRKRLLAGELLGHDQDEGWRLWPSRRPVTDVVVEQIRSLNAARDEKSPAMPGSMAELLARGPVQP